MKRLPYIEDYIDLLGGGAMFWPPRDPIIKLARYDEPIVQSMAEQVNKGTGLTDRQSVLAHKIVVKYRRQWATAGYDVSDQVDQPRFKLPIRQVDRRRIIDIVDDTIEIKFPYDQDLISKLRADATTIPGSLRWNGDRHAWCSPVIEPRIIWAKTFGAEHSFEFGAEFERVLAESLEQEDYAIRLVPQGQAYIIENAAQSMTDYIEQHLGFDDAVRLIDMSSVLAYEVCDSIKQTIKQQHSPLVADILLAQSVNCTYTDEITTVNQVVEYAKLVNRWPIYVYESGSKSLYNQISALFAREEIISQGHHLLTDEQLQQSRVVYFSHWKTARHNMPLLITMHTLLIGHRRQQVAALAEKIVYYTKLTETADA